MMGKMSDAFFADDLFPSRWRAIAIPSRVTRRRRIPRGMSAPIGGTSWKSTPIILAD